MVAVDRIVPVRRVGMVAVEKKELAAHAVSAAGGAFGVGVGGSGGDSGGGSLLGFADLSHREAQPEEEQQEPKAWCGQHDPLWYGPESVGRECGEGGGFPAS
jgi:hypothetical protein